MNNFGAKANFLWSIAELLRDRFKRGKYQDVILPFIRQLEQRISNDPALEANIKVNPPEDARLTFNQIVNDKLQDMVDSNFKFYKQITDNADFADDFLSWMFERYRKSKGA